MSETIAIFGQYKSGTTTLFYRIKNSLPSNVRTLFEPREYIAEAGDSSRLVLAKVILGIPQGSASVSYDTFRDFSKKILLVRDPRDWLVSGTLFLIQQEAAIYNDEVKLQEVMELLRRKEKSPTEISLSQILEKIQTASPGNSLDRTIEWMRSQYAWVIEFENHLGHHFKIKYEEMTDGILSGLESYLGFGLAGSPEVDHIHDHVPRTRGYGNWKDWLLKEDVARFSPIFHDYIIRHGYSPEWTLSPHPVIEQEHCSSYVERVVKKRRSNSIRTGILS